MARFRTTQAIMQKYQFYVEQMETAVLHGSIFFLDCDTYVSGAHIMKYIYEFYGEEKAPLIFKTDANYLWDAISEALGVSPQEFEDNWAEWIHDEFSLGKSEEHASNADKTFAIDQNYPNPFVFQTAILYRLPVEIEASLTIYSFTGQLVQTLVNTKKEAGYYEIVWDGRDHSGKKVSSGIYFYKLQTDNHTETRKMILLR